MFEKSTIERFRDEGNNAYPQKDDIAQKIRVSSAFLKFLPQMATCVLALALVLLLPIGIKFSYDNSKNPSAGLKSEETQNFSSGDVSHLEATGGNNAPFALELPSGKLSRGSYTNNDNKTAYEVLWKAGGFSCHGDTIKSVTYTAQNGGFMKHDNMTIRFGVPMASVDPDAYAYRRHFPISKELSEKIKELNHDENAAEFAAYLNSGALDSILGVELRKEVSADVGRTWQQSDLENEDFDPERTWLLSGLTDANGKFNSDSAFDSTLPTHYELQLYQSEGPNQPTGWKLDESITVSQGEAVNYSPEFLAFKTIFEDEAVDFTQIPQDVITVTAELKSGEKQIKTVVVSFDKDGNLCARLDEESNSTVSYVDNRLN